MINQGKGPDGDGHVKLPPGGPIPTWVAAGLRACLWAYRSKMATSDLTRDGGAVIRRDPKGN